MDAERRWGAARNHTATHLLHRALRDVLGEQAKQAGSYVAPDALRFDFPAQGATPRASLREVERRVNEQVRRDAEVLPETMSMTEAQALGADMFFGEKYLPESVRVVQVAGYSRELCGGTHVARTGQIGTFVITGESSIGAGLRRIEAVTGAAAVELVAARLEALRATAQLLGEQEAAVPSRVEALLARLRDAERAAKGPAATTVARLDAAAALAEARDAGSAKVVVASYPDADAGALRGLVDDLRGMAGRFVAVLGGSADGQRDAARGGEPRPRRRGLRRRRGGQVHRCAHRRRRRGTRRPGAGWRPRRHPPRRGSPRGRAARPRDARAPRGRLTLAGSVRAPCRI